MTHVNYHECSLPKTDYGLPKLAPNAKWTEKLIRKLKKLIYVNPKNFKCKKLFRNEAAILAEIKRHATGPYYFVIHPMSRINSFLEALFFIVWYYSLVVEPLQHFMSDDAAAFYEYVQLYVISPIRLGLILIFFNIGYINNKTSQITLESKKIIKKYLQTYFVLDVLATPYPIHFPLKYFESVFEGYHVINIFLKISFTLRILCSCVRFPTLLSIINHVLGKLKVARSLMFIFYYMAKTLMIIHLFCYMMVMLPSLSYINNQVTPVQSWLYHAGFVGESKAFFEKYGDAFVLVSCYFFGVEHNFSVTILIEQIVVIFITFFGRLYTLYFLADVLRFFGIVGISESMYERQMSVIRKYMIDQDLQDNLRERMLDYYEHKYQGHYFEEERVINNLSENLRIELFLFAARKMFRKVQIFKKIPTTDLPLIIALMKTETYAPGDVIVRHGTSTRKIYFISSGTVAIMTGEGVELCHLEDGDEFGTRCLFSQKQIFDAVAVEMTVLFIIDKAEFQHFLSFYPEVRSKFLLSVKAKHGKLRSLLEDCTGKIDVFSQAARGNIFEKPTERVKVAEGH